MNRIILLCLLVHYSIQSAALLTKYELLEYAKQQKLTLPTPNNCSQHKTYNKRGNAKPQTDPIALSFLANIIKQSNAENKVLVMEIGAAYGFLAKDVFDNTPQNNVEYTCIDLSPQHLAIATQLINTMSPTIFDNWNPIIGKFPLTSDCHNIYRHIGMFSVIHFLTPKELIASLKEIEQLLVTGGKAYFLTMHYTVPYYGKCIQHSYEKNKTKGKPYPGFIKDMLKYINKYTAQGTVDSAIAGRTDFAPHYLFLDTQELVKIITDNTHLTVDYAATVASRLYTTAQEPQQYVGIIASKP